MDFFAPEFKQDANIINKDSFLERVDVWSFGMIFYKLLFGEVPVFDLEKKPIFPQYSNNLSAKNRNIVQKCLELDPYQRVNWS